MVKFNRVAHALIELGFWPRGANRVALPHSDFQKIGSQEGIFVAPTLARRSRFSSIGRAKKYYFTHLLRNPLYQQPLWTITFISYNEF